jgi:hypothetical protein
MVNVSQVACPGAGLQTLAKCVFMVSALPRSFPVWQQLRQVPLRVHSVRDTESAALRGER